MNNKTKKARQIGLSILKPSKKDLEHGLELHKDSIVWDSYGFVPNSAVDGDAIRKAAEEGASDIELIELTEEMRMMRHVIDKAERQEFKDAWEASGVTCVFQNAGTSSNAISQLIKRFAHFTYVSDMMRGYLNRSVIPVDIENTKKQKRHCLYLCTNGVPLSQQWNSVEEELSYIRIFFQLGCRMMHLTYNRRNQIGDGCGESANAGLSDFGRAVVREMNKVGVIVDVAHSGLQTSLEAAKVSEQPIVASHTTCLAVNEHCRAKSDKVIKEIANKNGYIGICCIPGFLGKSGDITALLDHIDYVAKKFGVDHVAIGTDAAYMSQNNEGEHFKTPKFYMSQDHGKVSLKNLKRRITRNPWWSFWPPGSLSSHAFSEKARLSLSWTNWPLFTVGLVQRGYSDNDIQKIIGGNVLRVSRAVLRGSLYEKK